MPLSRRSLSAGALAAMLLAGCAGAPPPASAPLPPTPAGAILGPGVTSMQLYGSVAAADSAPRIIKIQAGCEPNDPMAFDPGPRVDSLAILRAPGGWVAPMPNACPVDARFQLQQPSRYVTVRGRSTPAPKPR